MENIKEKITFKYCDILKATDDFDVKLENGKSEHIKKGSIAIVGFDDSIHYLRQKLIEKIDFDIAEIEGISLQGLISYISTYLDSKMSLSDILKCAKINMEMFTDYLEEAFKELGLKDNNKNKEEHK